ncbi:MAG: inorganic phosphate transporter [Nitrososphaerales archaeon]
MSLLLAFTLGWNNSGLTTGNLSNLIRYDIALVVTLAGILTGFLVEGQKMSHSILGKLVITQVSVGELAVATTVSFALFLVLTLAKIPVSLSNCVVGAFAGVAISVGGVINNGFALEIIISWISAPFLCALVSVLVYEAVVKSEQSISLPNVSWVNRVILLAAVFYISYTLGANNVGLIFSIVADAIGSVQSSLLIGLLEFAIFLSLAVGTVLFGRAIAKIVGDKIIGLSQVKTLSALLGAATVTWVLTQLSVPVSLTQVVIGGMLGAGVARGLSVVNGKEVSLMIRDWTLVTMLCTLAGYGIETLIQRI